MTGGTIVGTTTGTIIIVAIITVTTGTGVTIAETGAPITGVATITATPTDAFTTSMADAAFIPVRRSSSSSKGRC